MKVMEKQAFKKSVLFLVCVLLFLDFSGCSNKKITISNPSGMTPVETVQRYFYYWQEKNGDGMNSLLYLDKCNENFARYKSLKLISCLEHVGDDDWDEVWEKNDVYQHICMDVSFEESYLRDGEVDYTTSTVDSQFYLVRKSKDSDWLIATWVCK